MHVHTVAELSCLKTTSQSFLWSMYIVHTWKENLNIPFYAHKSLIQILEDNSTPVCLKAICIKFKIVHFRTTAFLKLEKKESTNCFSDFSFWLKSCGITPQYHACAHYNRSPQLHVEMSLRLLVESVKDRRFAVYYGQFPYLFMAKLLLPFILLPSVSWVVVKGTARISLQN